MAKNNFIFFQILFKCCCLFLFLCITARTTGFESSGEKNNKGSNLNVKNTKNSGHNKLGITEKNNENNNSEISYESDGLDEYGKIEESFVYDDFGISQYKSRRSTLEDPNINLDHQLECRNLFNVYSRADDTYCNPPISNFDLIVKKSNLEKLLFVAKKYKWELLSFHAISTSNEIYQQMIAANFQFSHQHTSCFLSI